MHVILFSSQIMENKHLQHSTGVNKKTHLETKIIGSAVETAKRWTAWYDDTLK